MAPTGGELVLDLRTEGGESSELFRSRPDDVAVQPVAVPVQAGTAAALFCDRSATQGAIAPVGEQFGFADGFLDGRRFVWFWRFVEFDFVDSGL